MTSLLDFARESPWWTLFYLWGAGITAIGVAGGIGRLAIIKTEVRKCDCEQEE